MTTFMLRQKAAAVIDHPLFSWHLLPLHAHVRACTHSPHALLILARGGWYSWKHSQWTVQVGVAIAAFGCRSAVRCCLLGCDKEGAEANDNRSL